jgi:hypothetical protein
MFRPINVVRLSVIGAALGAALPGVTVAQKDSPTKQAVPTPQNKPAAAQTDVAQLLFLVADKDGNVSKQEFTRFMATEFDLLNKDKTGNLNVKELPQSTPRLGSLAGAGR